MIALGIAAHPDDLDFAASGTFAKWAKEGASCYYLICTDGSKGSSDPKMTSARLARIRKAEQVAAGKAIGLKGVFFLGHKDAELVADLGLKKEMVRYIRKLRPDVVVASDPMPFYYADGSINHTDHRAAGEAAIDAVYPLARDRLAFKDLDREGLAPHKVRTLYLVSMGRGGQLVDISGTISVKLKALACHGSQVRGGTLAWVKEMSRRLGKGKGYGYAESFVKLDMPD